MTEPNTEIDTSIEAYRNPDWNADPVKVDFSDRLDFSNDLSADISYPGRDYGKYFGSGSNLSNQNQAVDIDIDFDDSRMDLDSDFQFNNDLYQDVGSSFDYDFDSYMSLVDTDEISPFPDSPMMNSYGATFASSMAQTTMQAVAAQAKKTEQESSGGKDEKSFFGMLRDNADWLAVMFGLGFNIWQSNENKKERKALIAQQEAYESKILKDKQAYATSERIAAQDFQKSLRGGAVTTSGKSVFAKRGESA